MEISKYWNDCFSYNSDGSLTWKVRPETHFPTKKGAVAFNSIYPGKIAGSKIADGYILIGIKGRMVRAHRIVYEMHHGPIPAKMDIDHINGIRSDNRIDNLRIATRSQNLANMQMHPRNTSGAKGVYWHKRAKKWLAQIKSNKKHYYIGLFDTLDSASSAYEKIAVELNKDFANIAKPMKQ
jgi:hypothetical protein